MISFVHRATIDLSQIRFPTDTLVVGEARRWCPDTDHPHSPDDGPEAGVAALLKEERAFAQIAYSRATGRALPEHVKHFTAFDDDWLVQRIAAGYRIFHLARDEAEARDLILGVLDQVKAQVQRRGR